MGPAPTRIIGIDCRFAATRTGLGRYTREIVSHLLARRDPVSYVLFARSVAEPWIATLPGAPRIIEASFPHYSLAEQFRFPAVIARSGIDLLFSPHFNVPVRCPVPFVATIHDLILHAYPNQASLLRRIAYRMVMRSAVRRAKAIIAVSAFTAEELMRVYGSSIRNATTVIPEGVDAAFQRPSGASIHATLERHAVTQPYFLYVGNAKQHKNVQMLIDAFASSGVKESLILVTGGAEAQDLGLADRVRILADVADEDLPALYSGARAFVTASLYEGFCLPLLEARACGCPVIAVNRTAIPETAGADALPVEPDISSLAEALRHPPEHATEVPSDFSWERAATRTAELLVSN